nr:ATP-binding protein [Lachnospiraceae bacterium]
MKIIGRRDEIYELERCEKSNKSELVCVYGRRRVGKTYLVEQTFSDYFAFRATGVETGNTRTQLKAFNQRLKDCGDEERKIPEDWFEAFSRLERVLKKETIRRSAHGKKIVFFDEFPWLATARSDFLVAFEEFWNRCGTVSGDYMFIICGSATSWIIKNIISNTGSLYNRVTSRLFLKP